MKVMVTGASGFLGSHICDAAHREGHQVHALIREKSSRQWLSHDWLSIHVADLEDHSALRNILDGMHAVIHAAGATSGYTRKDFARVNVETTRTLAHAAAKAGVRKFVFISSQSAGGPNELPLPKTEQDPDRPISLYGETKKKAEELLEDISDELGVVILRYPAIYGPRDAQMLRVFRMFSGWIHPIPGFKPLYTSMVYAEDAARAAVKALNADVRSGSIYYISDGVNYNSHYLHELVTRVLGTGGLVIHVPFWLVSLAAWWVHSVRKERTTFTLDKVREMKARFWLVSPMKAMKELGWKPEVMPAQGLAQTVRWYRYKRWL